MSCATSEMHLPETPGATTPRPTAQQDTAAFTEAYGRILSVLGVRTQTDAANALGIRQSSISDAKRRNSIPDGWLLLLVTEYSINPLWIMRGTGAKHLVPEDIALNYPDVERYLNAASAGTLLRVLARRMGSHDIQIVEGGAA